MSNWKKLDFLQIDPKGPQSSLEINYDNFLQSTSKHILIGSRYKAIRHSEQINKINEFISRNRKTGFCLDKIKFPSKEKDIFYNQLKILIIKMKVFEIFSKKYNLRSRENLGEILLGTLRGGFKFNSDYKKRLENYTREYLRGETDYVYQDYPASHLLPWLDEDPIEKIYVFSDPIKIKKKTFEKVESVMDEYILDDALIRDIDLIDAFYLINRKKMNHLDKKGRTKTAFECRGDECDISFPENELDYLFKKVTTDPATSRMAGLPTVKTRNVGYAAHTNLDLITINARDYYKTGIEPLYWQDKLTKFDGYFIMIDFKKSGLTTNREVIKSVYRQAKKHYPGFRPFAAYLDCLENIRVNGMYSKRGTSLGMDDNAISFFLSCAFEAFLRSNSQYIDCVDAYFKGDDQIIICKTDLETTKEIFRLWLKDLKELGFLVNAKKSFIGLRGQFCEIVGRGSGIDTKEIEFSLNSFDALGAYNYIDFKTFIRNLKMVADENHRYSRIFNYCLISTIMSVEPEFGTYDEIYAPFEMGGYFSNYEKRLNTFIVDVCENKFKLDRRLYNIIGLTTPDVVFDYKKRRQHFESIFRDTSNILEKMKKISVEPMSVKWRKSYDDLQEKRRAAFNGKIELIGSKLQLLIDEKHNYALPIEMLTPNPRKERVFVPRKKRIKGKIYKAIGNKLPPSLLNKTAQKYYLIDDIRARELLLSAEDGNNKFLINYYYRIPASTLIWSICKSVAVSDWCIPINWLEYCNRTRVSLDNLWSYYSSKGINLYDYKPRIDLDERDLSELFRGDDDSDTVTICQWSGMPLKFRSWDYQVWKEQKSLDKKFFLDIAEKFFREWFDEQHQLAWWGKEGRNRPFEKEKFLRVKHLQEVENLLVDTNYMMQLEPYLVEQGYLPPREEEIPEYLPLDIVEEGYESEHLSDSDMLEEYFKDNPLNADTDNEDDPYQFSSSSSEEQEE